VDHVIELSGSKGASSSSLMIAHAGRFWQACVVAAVLAAFNPTSLAYYIWHGGPPTVCASLRTLLSSV
jgi:hypothetical protein